MTTKESKQSHRRQEDKSQQMALPNIVSNTESWITPLCMKIER